MKAILTAAACALFAGSLAWAEPTQSDLVPFEPSPVPVSPSVPPLPAPSAVQARAAGSSVGESSALNFGIRIDSSYIGGDPVYQGFSIPSVRLTAFGDASNNLSYRLSAGETRDFSTLMLPQLLPVEAYIKLDSLPHDVLAGTSHFSLQAGMFTPSFNPWWTPDLSDLPIPDYNLSDRALLISRDIGAQVSWVAIPDRLEVAIGAFNGDGIVALNTNDSKAFTGFVRGGVPLGNWRLDVGVGGYSFTQSETGSVNYKSQWVANVFSSLEWLPGGVNLYAEGLVGKYDTGAAVFQPSGGSVMMILGNGWLKLFTRYENIGQAPTNSGTLRQFQLGPLLVPIGNLKVWALYQTVDDGTGTMEGSFLVRLRFVM